jgi:adenylylsulfate kinase
MSEKLHIIPHDHKVKQADRMAQKGHSAKTIWFVGLSGSGKSTLASGLEFRLHQKGIHTYILDGDNIRSGLNQDLDFSQNGRIENIRRIAHVCKLFNDAGIVVLTAFISPFMADRAQAEQIVGAENFIEVYVSCPLEICEQRDVKGLYKKARAGEISNFTGISSPFEAPESPAITVNTDLEPLDNSLLKIEEFILPNILK